MLIFLGITYLSVLLFLHGTRAFVIVHVACSLSGAGLVCCIHDVMTSGVELDF